MYILHTLPIFLLLAYFTYFAYFELFRIFVMVYFFLETLFNINEDLRAKPSSRYNVGWMPIIDEGESCGPGQGYDSDAARNVRVHQECWIIFLRPFIQNTIAPLFDPKLPEMMKIDCTDPFFVFRFLQSIYTNYLDHVKKNNGNLVTEILSHCRLNGVFDKKEESRENALRLTICA